METVLVTGGCGYIGSHTSISLIKNGYKVIILDSFINSSRDSFKRILKTLKKQDDKNKYHIKFIEADLRDELLILRLFKDQIKAGAPIKAVIHFAGLKSIDASIKSPLDYWEMNLRSTLSLLKAMKKYKCFKLIFSSSANVYKMKSSGLLKERDFLEPTSPYGKTKLTIENILKDLYESDKKNWKIANLRYFNPVGAHEFGFLGEEPIIEATNLFPAISKVIRKEQNKLLIYGNDWPTKDGTCIRDFIHIMDLSDAHSATLDYLINNKSTCLTLNIGTGIGSSILEVIKVFEELGTKIPHKFTDRRYGDHPFVVADNALALKLLNWSPKRKLINMCRDSLKNILSK